MQILNLNLDALIETGEVQNMFILNDQHLTDQIYEPLKIFSFLSIIYIGDQMFVNKKIVGSWIGRWNNMS